MAAHVSGIRSTNTDPAARTRAPGEADGGSDNADAFASAMGRTHDAADPVGGEGAGGNDPEIQEEAEDLQGRSGNALHGYMGSRFLQVNHALRTGPSAPSAEAQNILGELKELPSVPAGTVLYRHVGGRNILKGDNTAYGDKKTTFAFRTGGSFTDNAFMSTTKEKPYIDGAISNLRKKQHVLAITTAENSRGHDVSGVRGNTKESEVLFEPRADFRITKKNNMKFGAKTARVWHLQEVPGPRADEQPSRQDTTSAAATRADRSEPDA